VELPIVAICMVWVKLPSKVSIAFQGIPIYHHNNGSLPMMAKLIKELGKNLPYKLCALVEGPVWTKATVANITKEVSAFMILLSDPGRKLPAIICKPAYMFGKRLTVSFMSKFIPFRQCTHCHILSHTTEECAVTSAASPTTLPRNTPTSAPTRRSTAGSYVTARFNASTASITANRARVTSPLMIAAHSRNLCRA